MHGNAHRYQRGVAMVEFTIVLPLMLLLLLGVTETGRAILQYNVVTKNTRAAVKHVASNALLGTTGTVNITAQLETEARNILVYGNPVGNPSTAYLPNLTGAQGQVIPLLPDHVSVRVDYPYQPMTGGVLQTFGLGPKPNLGITLGSPVTMRAL